MTTFEFVVAASLGGILGYLALASTFAQQIYGYLARFTDIFVARYAIKDRELAAAIHQHLVDNGKCSKSPFGMRFFFSKWVHTKIDDRQRLISFKNSLSGFQTFWIRRFVPLWYKYDETYWFSCIRGTVDFDKIVADATAEMEEAKGSATGRFEIYRCAGGYVRKSKGDADGPVPSGEEEDLSGLVAAEPLGFRKEDLGRQADARTLEEMALTDEHREVVQEVRFWRNKEAWHRERGVPWNLRYLFKGDPGTGKTRLGRSIAEEEDLPIYVLELGEMQDQNLREAVQKVYENAPAIAFIEDIDRIYDRDQVVAPMAPSFSCLLNVMDGVERQDGVLWILTTNHPERLDPALAQLSDEAEGIPTRPNRIDRIVDFPHLDAAGREKIACRILRDTPERVAEMVAKGAGDTGAQFQLRCFRLARALMFGKRA